MTDDDIQCPDVDLRFMFTVERMKMGRGMFPPEHLDDDSEKLADGTFASV